MRIEHRGRCALTVADVLGPACPMWVTEMEEGDGGRWGNRKVDDPSVTVWSEQVLSRPMPASAH